MKLEFRSTGSSRFGDQRNNWLHKRLWFNNKRSDHLRLVLADGDLARMLITEIAKVSAPKNKKNAPAAGESGNQRPKRRKDKNGRPVLASGSTKSGVLRSRVPTVSLPQHG